MLLFKEQKGEKCIYISVYIKTMSVYLIAKKQVLYSLKLN